MAASEKFALRWNDFHANLSQGFYSCFEDEDLVDVTIAVEDSYIQAHKLVLSVTSPYFKQLFKANACEHPIVILKDVSGLDLRHILQYMYKGEVHLRQEDLRRFLKLGEQLQVKGLYSPKQNALSTKVESADFPLNAGINTSTVCEDFVSTSEIVSGALQSPIPAAHPMISQACSLNGKRKSSPKKLKENDIFLNQPALNIKNEEHENIAYNTEKEVSPDKSEKKPKTSVKTRSIKCPSCNRYFANRYNLKVHKRDKHDNLDIDLQCKICDKRMRNHSCLRVHLYHHRKQAVYLSQYGLNLDETGKEEMLHENNSNPHLT